MAFVPTTPTLFVFVCLVTSSASGIKTPSIFLSCSLSPFRYFCWTCRRATLEAVLHAKIMSVTPLLNKYSTASSENFFMVSGLRGP